MQSLGGWPAVHGNEDQAWAAARGVTYSPRVTVPGLCGPHRSTRRPISARLASSHSIQLPSRLSEGGLPPYQARSCWRSARRDRGRLARDAGLSLAARLNRQGRPGGARAGLTPSRPQARPLPRARTRVIVTVLFSFLIKRHVSGTGCVRHDRRLAEPPRGGASGSDFARRHDARAKPLSLVSSRAVTDTKILYINGRGMTWQCASGTEQCGQPKPCHPVAGKRARAW
jgi:hypothetical protein